MKLRKNEQRNDFFWKENDVGNDRKRQKNDQKTMISFEKQRQRNNHLLT